MFFTLYVKVSVPSSACPVPNIFVLLSKNTARISMKFVGANHNNKQIK